MRCSGAIRPHRADSRFCQRVLVSLVGAISLLGIAFTDARLSAQEGANELTGCYDITVGDWIVPEPAPGQPPRPLPNETGDSAIYRDADAHANLQTRLRDRSGGAHRPSSDTVPEGVTYINPITEIRLTSWRNSGAHIRLSDHRYR